MVAFYKHDIPAWRGGTASLTLAQYRVYHTVIEQIMLEEGAIIPHEKALAGTCNISRRMFRAALDELVALGKLLVQDDGKVINVRANSELIRIEKNREHAATGGRVSANARRLLSERGENANKNNGHDEAPLNNILSLKEKTRLEKNKDSCQPDGWPPDYREQFWSSYPRRTERKAALAALDRVRKAGVSWAILKAGVERYAAAVSRVEPKYVKHPTTWLNKGCWDDDPGGQRGQEGLWDRGL